MTINERVARALNIRTQYREVDETWFWAPPDGPWVPLPDFEHSQDALDLYVQPDIERRGWRWWVRVQPDGWATAWIDEDANGNVSKDDAPTAALARCLAYLEAVEGGKGDG